MRPLSVRARAALALSPLLDRRESRSLSATLPGQVAACDPRDRALLTELVQGSARQFFYIDALLGRLLEKTPANSRIHALLVLGIYQLEFMRIPAHAAVQETVQAARELKQDRATGLINAILRRFQREHDELVSAAATRQHAHPVWLIQRLQKDWPEQWEAIVAANNGTPAITLRINPQLTDRDSYLRQLTEAGIEAEASPTARDGIRLLSRCDITTLPGFAEGLFSVQDGAAQLAAELLAPEAGELVLDACCAPGGKTVHLLQLQPALKGLVALDNDAARLKRVEENLQRSGVNATLLTADATELDDWWNGLEFDRILLDAPCTATGVIRRHPDIKLLRKEKDVTQTASLQAQLLKALWPTLKPGGTLLYATCSVLKQENEEQIARFLDQHSDARELPITADWGHARPHGRQLLPGETDGFYYALIRKTT